MKPTKLGTPLALGALVCCFGCIDRKHTVSDAAFDAGDALHAAADHAVSGDGSGGSAEDARIALPTDSRRPEDGAQPVDGAPADVTVTNAPDAPGPDLAPPPIDTAAPPAVDADSGDRPSDSASTGCFILGTAYEGDQLNPSNPCQVCRPATPTAWSPVGDGTGCPGNGQYCNAGACKSGCLVNSVFHPVGALDGTLCQVCRPSSPTSWSKVGDGTACGPGQVCRSGACEAGCWVNDSLIAEGQSQSCAASGALGACATGTRTCRSGEMTACSIQPAASDTCSPGNDDNCNGTANDTACKVLQISAGGSHTCALLSDRMVRCWGDNQFGQIGNGSTTFSPKPSLVVGLSGIASVVAGLRNTCAISTTGLLSCWGDGSEGQLGAAPESLSSVGIPQAISSTATSPAALVAVGTAHLCYLVSTDKTVRCWGQSRYGRLGNGTTVAGVVTTPTAVPNLSGVVSLAAGDAHTCVVLADGSVRCWGQNDKGQLGDEGTSPSALPVTVREGRSSVAGMLSVSSGPAGSHVCALGNDGAARCWGSDGNGQLGYGVSDGGYATSALPVLIADRTEDFRGMVALSAGGSHNCALLGDDTGVCWGRNGGGELGNSSNADAYTPVAITGLGQIATLSSGSSHTCALLSDGTPRCWGENRSSQVGDGTTTPRSAPVAVKNLLP